MTVVGVDSSKYNTRQAADDMLDDFDSRLSSQNIPVRRSVYSSKVQNLKPVPSMDVVADRKPVTDYAGHDSLSSNNLPLASKAPPSRRKKLLVGGSVFLTIGGSIGTGVGVSEHNKKKRKEREAQNRNNDESYYGRGGRPIRIGGGARRR